ncbi:hypothetical protein H4R34_001968 [Dimargaris verticillata]|uniref:Uncharacterized protein n=1 Tax=Dimargaris verticillata TaxID=2761393 RepID=A0A9W8B7E3_9FUNG|nr:hypothetical protein H4R34_001968 [Dimargaris verticillata]
MSNDLGPSQPPPAAGDETPTRWDGPVLDSVDAHLVTGRVEDSLVSPSSAGSSTWRSEHPSIDLGPASSRPSWVEKTFTPITPTTGADTDFHSSLLSLGSGIQPLPLRTSVSSARTFSHPEPTLEHVTPSRHSSHLINSIYSMSPRPSVAPLNDLSPQTATSPTPTPTPNALHLQGRNSLPLT